MLWKRVDECKIRSLKTIAERNCDKFHIFFYKIQYLPDFNEQTASNCHFENNNK